MGAKATAKERAILEKIDAKLGPVGKGHHNSHRNAHLLEWLREKERSKKPRASA